MKRLITLFASLLLFTSLILAQPAVTSPTNYTLVDENSILTITFTDASNAGPSTYEVVFTAVVGPGQLAGSAGTDKTVSGLISSGGGPSYTVDVPATTLDDNTVYTFTLENTSDDPGNLSTAITISTGSALTAGTTTPPASPSALNPDVSWTDATGGFPPYVYDIYINDNTGSGHAGDVESSLNETSPYTTTASNTYNEDYFAIVAVTDAATSTLDYAEVSFTTLIATPVITNPTGSPFDYSLTPDIVWTLAGNDAGVTFIVEISDDGFGTIAYSASGATSPHTVGSAFDYNTFYDVRVRATKGAEDNTSATEDFKTLLPTPTLDSPVGGALVSATPTLSWSIDPNTETSDIVYDVYIDGGLVSGDQAGTTYISPTLSSGIHSWYVIIKDNNGAGGENTDISLSGSPETFEVRFALISPVNSITGISILPKFVWSDDNGNFVGTETFTIEIDDNSDFSSIEHTLTVTDADYTFGGGEFTYQVKEIDDNMPLVNGKKYHWRVIENATPAQSEEWYFTTVTNVNISLYNPGNGIKLYAYDPAMFTWGISQAQGALKYYLQIKASGVAPTTAEWFADVDAEITTPGSIDFFYDHQSDSWKNVNGLDGGTRYYWRVVAFYDDGTTPNAFDYEDRVVKYSSAFYFDTEGGAVKAYPSWPTGGATIYYLDPTFYWYTMQWEPGATFEVIYSDDPTEAGGVLSNPLGTISAGSNMYVYIGTDLDPSTTYYWQVRTTYGIETNYSSIASFKTYDAPGLVPTAANPSYPTGGLEIYTTAPTFYWWIGAANTSVNFEVQVSTDNTFGVIDFTFGPTTDLYVQGSGLVPGEYYYWRVRSYVTGPDEVFSTTAEFSVAGGLSSSVVLSWPVGNPTVYTDTPTLSWYVDGSTLGWDSFIVRWQKGSNSGNWATTYDGSYTTSDINETFYTTSPLEYGETYYWAVALYDGVNPPAHGDFSYSSFTIAGNDANILLTNPANNSIILTKSPSFYWYVTGSMLGVTHFRVTYSNTELFNANVETVVTTTTSATVNGPLTEGATYWWYVELSYDGGVTWENPSSVWKFTVDAGASAVMPLVGSPARGVTIGTNSPTLSWYLPTQSQSALSYEVELSTNPDFSNATKYDNIAQLNSQVTDLTEGEYYWRVRSKTSGSTSNYSNTGNFKVGSVTSVEGEEELPLSYSIEQNYPNPFNPTTTINYSLPEANFVTIKIYNMLGQEVKTLLSEEVKAGRHNVNWNGENNYGSKVSSGTYVYRITAGGFVQAKKMILLK